jgi:hypothetical protein
MVVNDALSETLPDELLARAHRAECGALSWGAADTSAVAHFLLTVDFAVIGGEKYDLFPGAYWGTFAGEFATVSPDSRHLRGGELARACIAELEALLAREGDLRRRRYCLEVSDHAGLT